VISITVMDQEMECLDRNQTLTLVELPKDSKATGCRRVFHKKGQMSNTR